MKIIKKNLKVLLGAASAISLLFTAPSAYAAGQNDQQSPLLSQSQSSQSSISDMVNAIKNAAGGSVNAGNAGEAVSKAIGNNAGVSQDTIAAALNQLGLQGDALKAA